MIRALLDGRKTQTRRIAKVTDDGCKPGLITPLAGFAPRTPGDHVSYCPYGQPGDLLWVRETCRAEELDDTHGPIHEDGGRCAGLDGVRYAADSDFRPIENTAAAAEAWSAMHGYRGRRGENVPPIHMPRWASRITLRLTDVRVERVQDISNEDAVAEGIGAPTDIRYAAHDEFRPLWDSINAALGYGWDTNPWVWVLTFDVLHANVDQVIKEAAAARPRGGDQSSVAACEARGDTNNQPLRAGAFLGKH